MGDDGTEEFGDDIEIPKRKIIKNIDYMHNQMVGEE